MELFNETKNSYFHIVYEVLNSCADGADKSEILKLINDGEYEEKVMDDYKTFSGMLLNEYDEDENYNLLKNEDGKFYPILRNKNERSVPVRTTVIEKAWLKNLINNPCAAALLDKTATDKLSKTLTDAKGPDLSNIIENTNTALQEKINIDEFKDNFKIIADAIIKEKPIKYCNVDKNGNLYEDKTALPLRIEYSLKDEKFRASMFSLDDNRTVMVNLHTMSKVTILNNIKPAIDRKSAFKYLKEKRYSIEPLVIEVTDKKTAMERCFMSFSALERSSRFLGNDKYEIKLYYYTFEEDEVIRKILSLGPYVKVISPQIIVQRIVETLKKALEMQQ